MDDAVNVRDSPVWESLIIKSSEPNAPNNPTYITPFVCGGPYRIVCEPALQMFYEEMFDILLQKLIIVK